MVCVFVAMRRRYFIFRFDNRFDKKIETPLKRSGWISTSSETCPGPTFGMRHKISWLLFFLTTACAVAQARQGQESAVPPQLPGSAAAASAKDQWLLCKSMWLDHQKGSEGAGEWKHIVIQDVSLFGGFYAKGRVDNDPALPVHIIPNEEKIDAALLRQQLKEGALVDIAGTCVGMTQDGEVILEVDRVDLCR